MPEQEAQGPTVRFHPLNDTRLMRRELSAGDVLRVDDQEYTLSRDYAFDQHNQHRCEVAAEDVPFFRNYPKTLSGHFSLHGLKS